MQQTPTHSKGLHQGPDCDVQYVPHRLCSKHVNWNTSKCSWCPHLLCSSRYCASSKTAACTVLGAFFGGGTCTAVQALPNGDQHARHLRLCLTLHEQLGTVKTTRCCSGSCTGVLKTVRTVLHTAYNRQCCRHSTATASSISMRRPQVQRNKPIEWETSLQNAVAQYHT